MGKHIKYLSYLLRHKYHVGVACLKHGLVWQAIWHDWDKFLPSRWFPYARHTFEMGTILDNNGERAANEMPEGWQRGWLLHQRSKHHWQAWVVVGTGLNPLDIPAIYIKEMLCDWIGAGIACSGREDPRPWYERNKSRMVLSEKSREILESLLDRWCR